MVISKELRERIRQEAGNRCGYCLTAQQYLYVPLEIDHLIPSASEGGDAPENLWLACRSCNGFKGKRTSAPDPKTGKYVPLFNPRKQQWNRHFRWSADFTEVIGKTACGRATTVALQLNNKQAVETRRLWVSVGWHPPK